MFKNFKVNYRYGRPIQVLPPLIKHFLNFHSTPLNPNHQVQERCRSSSWRELSIGLHKYSPFCVAVLHLASCVSVSLIRSWVKAVLYLLCSMVAGSKHSETVKCVNQWLNCSRAPFFDSMNSFFLLLIHYFSDTLIQLISWHHCLLKCFPQQDMIGH